MSQELRANASKILQENKDTIAQVGGGILLGVASAAGLPYLQAHIPILTYEYVPITPIPLFIGSKAFLSLNNKFHFASHISPRVNDCFNGLNRILPLSFVLSFAISYFGVGMYTLDIFPDSWSWFSDDLFKQIKELFPEWLQPFIP